MLERSQPDIERTIFDFTDGYGTDAVIISAGSASLDPIDLAGTLSRKKGRVVVVGAVPTGFDRTNYYKKELDLRMSCSYGPGRYDLNYEEKGIDYPIGYVRWTENRNMSAFLKLLKDGKINIERIITHQYDFKNAKKAYQLIVDRSEPIGGIVFKFNPEDDIQESVVLENKNLPTADVNVGFIGAGNFAKNFLLPIVKKNANLVGVATAHGNTAVNIAQKYGFRFATANADEVIENRNLNTIFVATRHNLHAKYVIKALKKGKNVFVEKPLAMTHSELEDIKKVYASNESNAKLMVGYNRRFSPHAQRIKKILSEENPKAINYRINAGSAPHDHWVHDKEIGGGRIIGEVCHFVDLAMFLASAKIKSVAANVMRTNMSLLDTLIISLSFKNGSIANISYFSNGNKKVKKEYLEVFCAGQVAILDDFKKLTIFSNTVSNYKLSKPDKGHSTEIRTFLNSIKNGIPAPISFDEIYLCTLTSFKILESIREKKSIILK
jgi:polar amino acid transport system substrate-binding protein